MTELLEIAIEAHGGLARWDKVNSVQVNASITGAIWYVKKQANVLNDVVIVSENKHERLIMDFPGQNKRTIFEPNRVVIQTSQGDLVSARDDPRKSFQGQSFEAPWDDADVAYFSGEAMWTYLNIPFVYAQSGFETEEISPIQSAGETWRRLKVTFPDHVRSHTRKQISCFGPDGLLRRHDYTVDILGGARALNYATDYRQIGGIVFPATRRVVAYEGDYQPVMEPVLVAIDMKTIALSC